MDLRFCRDLLSFLIALLFSFMYIPHICCYWLSSSRQAIRHDVLCLSGKLHVRLQGLSALVFCLHNDEYFRTLFYHRLGPITALLIGWWRPGSRGLTISKTTELGAGVNFSHPYATILNAKSIGTNFSFRHLTTVGNKGFNGKRPVIGDNVTLGAQVLIIGDIRVGNNVVVGAGSVVVRDVPDNCVVAGNPAREIRSGISTEISKK
jgi:serine O-acetyltransferase